MNYGSNETEVSGGLTLERRPKEGRGSSACAEQAPLRHPCPTYPLRHKRFSLTFSLTWKLIQQPPLSHLCYPLLPRRLPPLSSLRYPQIPNWGYSFLPTLLYTLYYIPYIHPHTPITHTLVYKYIYVSFRIETE